MGRSVVGRWILSVFLGLVAAVVVCPPASAFVYWDNYDYAIGRANLDGGGQIPKFASLNGTPCGVASDGRYVYWADHLWGTIGRARIDGKQPADDRYITGLTSPCGVAVYEHHLYWANEGTYGHPGSIGRASLIGPLDLRPNFVPDTLPGPAYQYRQFCGVAVDATGIYWGDPDQNAIVRANTNGTGTAALITDASSPCGVTLVAGHILWTNSSSGTIGMALTNGTAINENYISGQYEPCGLTTYRGDLYWTSNSQQFGGGTVNKVALSSPNPTADTETLVMSIPNPCGVAVDGLFPGALRVISTRETNGLVSLTLSISTPGAVYARQAKPGLELLSSASAHTSHSGAVQLHLHLTRTGRRSIATRRGIRVVLQVSFQPRGGLAASKTVRVDLP